MHKGGRVSTQEKILLPWSSEYSQFPLTAAALGDTNAWKTQIYVLLNRASYVLKSMIQQDHECHLFPDICIWFAYSDFKSSFLCSSHDVKGLIVAFWVFPSNS